MKNYQVLPLMFALSALSSASAQAAGFLTANASAGCPGSTHEENLTSFTSGQLLASPAPSLYSDPDQVAACSAAAMSSFGHLSGYGAISNSIQSPPNSVRTGGGSASMTSNYYDPITVLNAATGSYLRMFYTFSFSGDLSVGSYGGNSNSFAAIYYLNGSPSVFSSFTAGSWNSTVSGAVDYTIQAGHTIVTAQVNGGSTCTTIAYSGESDSCSGSFNVEWTVTGWQVLDDSFQLIADATIQSESGASYTAPEPASFGLLAVGVGLALLRRRSVR